jgi:hypothetical protein
MKTPMPEAAQLEAVTHELQQLIDAGQPIQLMLGPVEAYALLGSIQLACRHPQVPEHTAAIAEQIGRSIQDALAPNPGPFAELLELSWNKQCQHCGCTNETPCIDSTGEPCHWVGPSLCSGCQPAAPLIIVPEVW